MYKLLPVFDTEALAELIGVTDDDIRGEVLGYEFYNDSCVYWNYGELFDTGVETVDNLNKKLRELDLPGDGVILIDVSW